MNISFPSNVPEHMDSPDVIRQKSLLALLSLLAGTPVTGPLTDAQLRASRLLVAPTSFKATASFQRPGDTNAYAQYDAVTNSTSAPAVMDLAISGAASGDFIDIRSARLCTSSKPSGVKLSANLFIAPATFTTSNDNAELSIADATEKTGRWISLANQYQTALNYRVASDAVAMLMQLSSGSVFGTVQANTAWVPGNADDIEVEISGYLYKA